MNSKQNMMNTQLLQNVILVIKLLQIFWNCKWKTYVKAQNMYVHM